MDAAINWMALVFTVSSESGYIVKEEGEGEKGKEEDEQAEKEAEEWLNYFPKILQ